MNLEVDAANRFLVDTFSGWVTARGKRSGAQNFYLRRLDSGVMIEPYEVAIGSFLVRTLDAADQSYEVGCGYGQLPLLLAWNGRRMIGFEQQSARFSGAEFLLERLGRYKPDAAQRLSFCNIRFPLEVDWHCLAGNRRNVLVFTNVVATTIKQQEEAILATLPRFDAVIMMLSHFGWHRSIQEQQDLRRRICALGMQPGDDIFLDRDKHVMSFLNRRGNATSNL